MKIYNCEIPIIENGIALTSEEVRMVKYDDHAAALAQSEEANAALRDELEQARVTIGELAASESTLIRYSHFYRETSKALQSRLADATELLRRATNLVSPIQYNWHAHAHTFLNPPSGVSGAGGSDERE